MSQTILVTGGRGFVGKQVLKWLANFDVKITLVVRDLQRVVEELDPTVETIITTPDLFAETAIWWENTLQGIDMVIHLAWYAEPGKYLESSRNIDCLQGTLNLAKGASKAGVRRIVGIGTCFEYDLSKCMLSIGTPLNPSTPYAAAKAATYLALSNWLPGQGVEFVWCRLFYLYGDGEDARRLIPYLRTKLAAGEVAELTRGNQIRDFLDVSVAGRLIVDVALGTTLGPINICSGIPITVRQLAETIADEYGRRDLLKFGARQENLVDPPCVIGFVNGK
jgi:nucleoside-diphosphate-sugar epimerase